MLERKTVLILAVFLLASCSASIQPAPQISGTPKNSADQPVSVEVPVTPDSVLHWADSMLSRLTLRQKVAQLIFPRTGAYYFAEDSKSYMRIKKLITDDEIGGLVVFQGDVMEQATLLNEWQKESRLPLWIMQDTENGLAMRTRNATIFPHVMALGAIDDTALTRRYARVVALENRAVGIHQALAPVVDVNNNPENPVINVRSFGQNPRLVARHGLAYTIGTEQGGLLPTLKHFPGHGDTETDSHAELPVLKVTSSRLDSLELVPYRYILAQRTPAVMIGHLALPQITGNYTPATLSGPVVEDLLKVQMGFKGLVVTDAMDMGAVVKNYGNVRAAIAALKAGNHCLILPVGEEQVIDGIVQAVSAGELAPSLIDSACMKILKLKEKTGLNRNRLTEIAAVRKTVSRGEHLSLAEEVANRSVTLIKNTHNWIPFNKNTPSRILTVVLSEGKDPETGGVFVRELRRETGKKIEFLLLDKRSNSLDFEIAAKRLDAFQNILIVSFLNTLSSGGKTTLPQDFTGWLQKNAKKLEGKRVAGIAFGTPYSLNSFPPFDALIATYSVSDNSQKAVADALAGQIPFLGKLPVSLLEFPAGTGIVPVRLTRTPDSAACEIKNPGFFKLENFAEESILEGVAPGMAVSVVTDKGVIYQNTFGFLTYEPGAPAVQCSTLFDLASVTKVLATTLSCMKLYDQGKFDIRAPLTDYYPEITDPEKKKITLWHLLTHTSGFESWRPFHLLGEPGKNEIYSTILNAKLAYAPGDSSIYSDWNFILLAGIIEKITGKPLDQFSAEEIYQPLGLKNTLFNPVGYDPSRIAPTELDTIWRKRLVRGTVHDETAQLLGGVSGHAGLFSTISDLSVLTGMLIRKGEWQGIRIISEETVHKFTVLESRKGLRALGWDIKSPKGYTSAGTKLGPATYGHLGFTGTSIWIDPDLKLGIVVLANRVYPTRANKKISAFRPKIYDLAAEAALK